MLASALGREQLPWITGSEQSDTIKDVMSRMGWTQAGNDTYPVVGGEKREARKLADVVLRGNKGSVGLGNSMMISLGRTMHSRYYGLAGAIGPPEPSPSGVGPPVATAMIGTGSAQVNLYSFAIIRALRSAGASWHGLMGWESDEWSECVETAIHHERDLLGRITAEANAAVIDGNPPITLLIE
jgi:hypothetical protein